MAPLTVCGWFETEDGATQFAFEGKNMREIAKQCLALDSDAGDTDLEAEDQDGEDVTVRLYKALEAIK